MLRFQVLLLLISFGVAIYSTVWSYLKLPTRRKHLEKWHYSCYIVILKLTKFSSFSSLLEKRKRRKFHWKSLQNRIPQCAKMCTKASRETPSPAVKSYHSIYKINKNLSLSNLGQMRLFQGFLNYVVFTKKVQKTFLFFFLDINDPVFQSNV